MQTKKVRLLPGEQIVWEAVKRLNDRGVPEPSVAQIGREIESGGYGPMAASTIYDNLKRLIGKGKAQRTLEALA